MKKICNLLTGLFIIILATSAFAAKSNVAALNNTKRVITKAKRVDQLYGMFQCHAQLTSPNTYHLVVNFMDYDATAGTLTGGTLLSPITVTFLSGPYYGSSFTYPAGVSSYDLGFFILPGSPVGTSYSISTSPTAINGWPIIQTFYVVN